MRNTVHLSQGKPAVLTSPYEHLGVQLGSNEGIGTEVVQLKTRGFTEISARKNNNILLSLENKSTPLFGVNLMYRVVISRKYAHPQHQQHTESITDVWMHVRQYKTTNFSATTVLDFEHETAFRWTHRYAILQGLSGNAFFFRRFYSWCNWSYGQESITVFLKSP